MDYPVFRIKSESLTFEKVSGKRAIGGLKDFLAKEGDAEFDDLKRKLLFTIESICSKLSNQSSGKIGYARVTLQEEAWAKSYRPVKKLFKTDRTPLVGGDGLGEMIIEVEPSTLQLVAKVMELVEHPSQSIQRNGMVRTIPSRLRCEISAIERIDLWEKADRLKFSAAVAVERLSDPTTGGGYYVELFRELKSKSEWDSLHEPQLTLHKSFIEGLQNMKQSIEVFVLPQQIHGKVSESETESNNRQESLTLFVRLTKSGNDNRFRLIDVSKKEYNLNFSEKADLQFKTIEPDISEHERLLSFLSQHPLVRRIELPGAWMESDEFSENEANDKTASKNSP